MEIAKNYSDWVTAVHLAAVRSGAAEFVEVVLAMVNRNNFTLWSFQDFINRAVIERLQHDTEVLRSLKDKLASNPTESEIREP